MPRTTFLIFRSDQHGWSSRNYIQIIYFVPRGVRGALATLHKRRPMQLLVASFHFPPPVTPGYTQNKANRATQANEQIVSYIDLLFYSWTIFAKGMFVPLSKYALLPFLPGVNHTSVTDTFKSTNQSSNSSTGLYFPRHDPMSSYRCYNTRSRVRMRRFPRARPLEADKRRQREHKRITIDRGKEKSFDRPSVHGMTYNIPMARNSATPSRVA